MTPSPSPLAQRLLALYPALADLPAALRDTTLAEHAQALCVPEGQLLFDEGTPCRGFPMVLSGEVRVARGTPNGRSLGLYRVGPGELCVASSTACLFGQALLGHGSVVHGTHQALADELGTVREMITRFCSSASNVPAGWPSAASGCRSSTPRRCGHWLLAGPRAAWPR